MNEKLNEYELETDWELIKQRSFNEWRNIVIRAVLIKNGKKLLENCQTKINDGVKINTKTKHIYQELSEEVYKAEAKKSITEGTKQRARTIFLARNGMLYCGKNMKGTIAEICPECKVIDDENHRLNICPKWGGTGNDDTDNEVEFNDIYSEDSQTLNRVISKIENVWEVKFANGRMKK